MQLVATGNHTVRIYTTFSLFCFFIANGLFFDQVKIEGSFFTAFRTISKWHCFVSHPKSLSSFKIYRSLSYKFHDLRNSFLVSSYFCSIQSCTFCPLTFVHVLQTICNEESLSNIHTVFPSRATLSAAVSSDGKSHIKIVVISETLLKCNSESTFQYWSTTWILTWF